MKQDVLIFDMDGTLYYSDSFIERYIDNLSENHELRIQMYRDFKDIMNVFNSRELRAFEYGCSRLGDVWQILFFIADKYELSGEVNYQAFIETRKTMIKNREITVNDKLIKTIKAIDVPKVLMTNSPENSAVPFINYLKLQNVFDMSIFDARKPYEMEEHLINIRKAFGDRKLIKIGDNLYNDIESSKAAGIESVFINHFNSQKLNEVTVHNLNQLTDYLNKKYMEVKR